MSESLIQEGSAERKAVSVNPFPTTSEGGRIAAIICQVGIALCFFAPWLVPGPGVGLISGATMQSRCQFGLWLWTIPCCAVAGIALSTQHEGLRNSLSTATALLVWLGIFDVMVNVGPENLMFIKWGMSLTFTFALILFAISGSSHVTRSVDLVARKLGSRKANVYSHWGSLTPGFHFSAKDFYEKMETAIKKREWPGVELLRVVHSEAGVLSHKREYLRVIRQRQLFDLCAGTFGTDYFFSIREAELPAVVTLRMVVAVALALIALGVLVFHYFGLLLGPFALLVFLAVGVWFLFNVLKMGLTQVDTVLLRTPVIGPMYEAWIRPETYFQQDSRIVFLQSVNELTRQLVEETVSAKGVKFLDGFERQPILDELYKRSRVRVNAGPE